MAGVICTCQSHCGVLRLARLAPLRPADIPHLRSCRWLLRLPSAPGRKLLDSCSTIWLVLHINEAMSRAISASGVVTYSYLEVTKTAVCGGQRGVEWPASNVLRSLAYSAFSAPSVIRFYCRWSSKVGSSLSVSGSLFKLWFQSQITEQQVTRNTM